jgi:hypothetical protein
LGLICRSLALSPLVVPFVVVSCGYVRLARLSTPDAITCLAALLAVWLILTRRQAAQAVSAVLPLFRTDFVLLSVLLAAYGWFDGRRTSALVSGLSAFGLYLVVNAAVGGYGWLTLINFALILGAYPYPESMPIADRVEPYLDVYLRGAWTIVRHPHILIYSGAALLYWSRTGRRAMPREQAATLGIMGAFVASHWLFFPVYGERFFSSAASVVLLVVLAHVQRLGQGGWLSLPAGARAVWRR